MNELNVLDDFSLLIPNKCYTSWKGNILINAHVIYVEIYCPDIPKLDNLEVCVPEIEKFNLYEFDLKDTVNTIKMKTNSLSNFVKDFVSVLRSVWKHDIFSKLQNCNNVYSDKKFCSVIREIILYEQYIHTIDDNLKYITFNILDLCKRDHFIKIYINEEYPVIKDKPLYFDTMLPSAVIDSLLKINTISELIEAFKDVVYKLNGFWDLHREIINTCHVIGHYTYKDVTFRIPVSNDVCIDVEIDVNFPNGCPKLNFHGQSRYVEKFQLRLNEIDPVTIWNFENNFKENILKVFGITDLPRQHVENNALDDFTIECPNNVNHCFICYDQLDTITKKQIKKCVNAKCDALYHMTCICTWLLNCGNTPMFDHLQGKCPQCDEDLLVALENFDLIKTKNILL